MNKEYIRNQVIILQNFLKEGGTKLTRSACYECISKIHGFKTWNDLSKFLKQTNKEQKMNENNYEQEQNGADWQQQEETEKMRYVVEGHCDETDETYYREKNHCDYLKEIELDVGVPAWGEI